MEPKLNTAYEVQVHQCQVQGCDHLPAPVGHIVPDRSQDAVGLLGHLGTLLAHVQPAVDRLPKVLFSCAAFQPLLPKPAALHGVVVTQVQGLALGLQFFYYGYIPVLCPTSPDCFAQAGAYHSFRFGSQFFLRASLANPILVFPISYVQLPESPVIVSM